MSLALHLSALAALVPAALLAVRPVSGSGPRLWLALAVAAAGAFGWSAVRLSGHWDPNLGVALWISVAASIVVFAAVVAVRPWAGRLVSLLGPYLLVMAILGTLTDEPAPEGAVAALPGGWVIVHILVSLATYALATVAAVAGLAVTLKERALKAKREGGWRGSLPSVVDADQLQFQLLLIALVVLGLGIATGMVLELDETGRLLVLDHKTILTFASFAVVAAVLALHAWSDLRGRRAARAVLVVYLLLTLAYPGVKAVHSLLLA
ncbi:cytochrome c biogenesis protein [Thalassobaculum fulvum]|uniref:Cytochrome c biogenesis protein n=1 Tax=Thalassobaculum fulvum TaxID=1633335 RepID=A0A918XRN1_9PROT|nr:cytochrome c biogenesis protein CcsA [Thalassobaculum fulvum]GHD47444.1 cytochrome c biogenesis protein [Thalassobaculum fulvum]